MSLHIVCPQCHATNRLPPERLGDSPDCGRCHRPLFTGKPISLTTADFDRHAGKNDIPLLVDFWAPWCGPCRMMAPAFEQAARQLEPHFRLAKVNTEEEQLLGARHAIRSIPTLAIFAGGKEITRQAGAMGTEDIVRWARSVAR